MIRISWCGWVHPCGVIRAGGGVRHTSWVSGLSWHSRKWAGKVTTPA